MSEFIKLYKNYLKGKLSKTESEQFFKEFKGRKKSEILETLDKIDIESTMDFSGEKSWYELNRTLVSINSRFKIFKLRILSAASIVALCVLSFFFLNKGDKMTLQTGFEEVKQYELGDGSQVQLGANSSLTYFFPKWIGKRKVFLEGKCLFDVQPSKYKSQFVVNLDGSKVAVLGTKFTIDKGEKQTEIYLQEGKVLWSSEDDSRQMHPGNKIIYTPETKDFQFFEKVDEDLELAWTRNEFRLEGVLFSDLITEISDYYGNEFEIHDQSILDKEIYLGIPISDWENMKEALELILEIKFTKKQNGIYLIDNKL